jgi:hypothetical protein
MRNFIVLGLLIISLSCVSCKKDNTTTATSTIHGYFQYSYINHSWGDENYGWIIDKSGNVKSYNNPKNWNTPDSLGYIGEQQLEDNISYCNSIVNTVTNNDLANYNLLVDAASRGKLITRRQEVYDMGAMTYYCYWYDTVKGKYKQILLSQTGYLIIINTDYNAMMINIWLKTINRK